MSLDPQTEPPMDPVDSQLLELLDGDLSGPKKEEIERLLLEDPRLRKRFRQFQRSLEMLDDLPRKTLDRKFASTTAELVVGKTNEELNTGPVAARAERFGLWSILTLGALAMVIGGSLVAGFRYGKFHGQLADLAVVQHLDALLSVKDYTDESAVDFLSRLSEDPRWQEHLRKGQDNGELTILESVSLSESPISARASRVAAMEDDERARLELDWERWQGFDADTQARLRKLSKKLSEKEPSLLVQARYLAVWQSKLPFAVEAQLRSLPTEKRLERMHSEFAQIERNWINEDQRKLIEQIANETLDRWEKKPPAFVEETRQKLDAEGVKYSFRDLVRRSFGTLYKRNELGRLQQAIDLSPYDPEQVESADIRQVIWEIMRTPHSSVSAAKQRYQNISEVEKQDYDLLDPDRAMELLHRQLGVRGSGGGPPFSRKDKHGGPPFPGKGGPGPKGREPMDFPPLKSNEETGPK